MCIDMYLKKYLTIKLIYLTVQPISRQHVLTRAIVIRNFRVLCHQDKIRRRAAGPQSAHVLRVGG